MVSTHREIHAKVIQKSLRGALNQSSRLVDIDHDATAPDANYHGSTSPLSPSILHHSLASDYNSKSLLGERLEFWPHRYFFGHSKPRNTSLRSAE
jgi:hypothetical protein